VADAPVSPSSAGAMDSLLEKLRAAAPQARDQRDRRRRARLKERHQVRVASGQKIPDLPLKDDVEDGSNGLLTPDNIADGEGSGSVSDAQVSESDDVADRAASMLQGLRGDGDGDVDRDSNLRVRRRRESADDERRQRRMRRRTAAESTSGDRNSALPPVQEGNSINEGPSGEAEDDGDSKDGGDDNRERGSVSTPTIIVSPTYPDHDAAGSPQKPLEIHD
jgi:cytokinesis protein